MAAEYLGGFAPVPAALVVGNHDLEGSEFDSDEANLAAWAQVRACTHAAPAASGGAQKLNRLRYMHMREQRPAGESLHQAISSMQVRKRLR